MSLSGPLGRPLALAIAALLLGALSSCVALPPPQEWTTTESDEDDRGAPPPPEPPVSAEPRTHLDLAEIVARVRERNPRIAAAGGALERARALVDEARSLAYPRLDARGAWVRFIEAANFRGRSGTDVSGSTTRTRFVSGRGSDIYSYGVDASYPLFDGGAAWYQRRAAEAAAEAASSDVETTVEDLEVRSLELYLGVLLAEGAVRIAEQSVSFAAREAELARARAEVGEGLAVDALRFETRASEERLVLNRAKALRRTQLAALAELIDTPLSDDVELAVPEAEEAVADPEGDLVAVALENRSELRAAEARRQEVAHRLGAESAAWWPTLGVFGSYGVLTIDTLRVSQDDDELQVGAAAAWNLFEGGATRARLAALRAETLEQAERERELRLLVEREVREAQVEVDVARENFEVSSETVRLSEAVLENETARYRAGEAQVIDVTSAELDRTRAQLARLNNRVQLFLARVRLRRAIGWPVVPGEAPVVESIGR